MKKLLIGSISFIAVLIVGTSTTSYSPLADHGRLPGPATSSFLYSEGHTGGISKVESHGHTGVAAEGNGGGTLQNR